MVNPLGDGGVSAQRLLETARIGRIFRSVGIHGDNKPAVRRNHRHIDQVERTGCPDASVDAVISVNNVMLWDRPAGFREVLRVLRPGGRLVLTVHRHVLDFPPERLLADATAAGFTGLRLTRRPRRLNSDAVQLLARRPS